MTSVSARMEERKRGGYELFQFTLAGFHNDGTHATREGASRLGLPLGDGPPDAGIDHAIRMDCARAGGEREAVRDAAVGRTKGGEGQRGKGFGALSPRANAGGNGWRIGEEGERRRHRFVAFWFCVGLGLAGNVFVSSDLFLFKYRSQVFPTFRSNDDVGVPSIISSHQQCIRRLSLRHDPMLEI
jgi:hypothetical protein